MPQSTLDRESRETVALRRELDRVRSESANRIEKAVARARNAELKIAAALRAEHDARRELETLQVHRREASARTEEARRRICEADASVAPLENRVAALEADLAARDGELGELRDAAADHALSSSVVADLRCELERVVADRDETLRSRCDLDNEVATQRAELAELREDTQPSKPAGQQKKLLGSLRSAEREMAMARTLIASLEQQCEQAARRAAHAHTELEDERRRSAQMRKQFARLAEARTVDRSQRTLTPRADMPRSERPTGHMRAVC